MLTVRQLTRPGLEPVDLDVADGECIALSGPSGAGKTIALRAIADLDPNRGTVSLDGADRESMPAPQWRQQVCYMAAEPGWWAETPGAHFPDRAAAAPWLPELNLTPEMLDAPLARLSTGERQRLALVRVLLLVPRVMLLDEPTSGLDPEATARIEDILKAQMERGTSIILVTHAREQAIRMAHRRFTIHDGKVTEETP